MVTKPQWATQQRRAHLVKLFQEYGNRCLKGHLVCADYRHYVARSVRQEPAAERVWLDCVDQDGNKTGQRIDAWQVGRISVTTAYFSRQYDQVAETVIDSWKAEDRETRSMLLQLEQDTLHDGTYGRYGGGFDPVARDVYQQTRPVYHLMAFGVAAESKQRIAVIRLPGTNLRLHVAVASAYQGVKVSKNQRRKMARYQSGPPAPVWQEIDRLCCAAVAAFWDSRGR